MRPHIIRVHTGKGPHSPSHSHPLLFRKYHWGGWNGSLTRKKSISLGFISFRDHGENSSLTCGAPLGLELEQSRQLSRSRTCLPASTGCGTTRLPQCRWVCRGPRSRCRRERTQWECSTCWTSSTCSAGMRGTGWVRAWSAPPSWLCDWARGYPRVSPGGEKSRKNIFYIMGIFEKKNRCKLY